MRVSSVLKGVKFKASGPVGRVQVSHIACDSRALVKGGIFVALKGCAQNGYQYIRDAVRAGAAVIVSEKDFHAPSGVLKILVGDTRTALPVMAVNFYENPSGRLKIIGVTGTNGKTTITYLIETILKKGGYLTGVIGTINYRYADKVIPARNTTPGPIELQSMLAEMSSLGLTHAVMEVSSHALDQQRVDGVSFDSAIFTNITNEHLDYHKNPEDYLKAKLKIFGKLKKDGFAVLNADDAKVLSAKKYFKGNIITYGIKEKADVNADGIAISLGGSKFTIHAPAWSLEIDTALTGIHNVSNILASIAVSIALGIKPDAIKEGIKALGYVPGRLEALDEGQDYKVFVDYAHTEDALTNVLGLLKEAAKKRIITVFGCGGNRDRAKRPLMGKAACRYSDHVIITSDNPRFEDPNDIIREIESGVKNDFSNYEIIPDRRMAIDAALSSASSGDVVIIAGKGHEDYQIIKDRTLHFDDREVIREMLRNKAYESKRDNRNRSRQAVIG